MLPPWLIISQAPPPHTITLSVGTVTYEVMEGRMHMFSTYYQKFSWRLSASSESAERKCAPVFFFAESWLFRIKSEHKIGILENQFLITSYLRLFVDFPSAYIFLPWARFYGSLKLKKNQPLDEKPHFFPPWHSGDFFISWPEAPTVWPGEGSRSVAAIRQLERGRGFI